MATAMAFPETQQGKKRTSSLKKEVTDVSDAQVSRARFVLRNNPPAN
jgi:hypothetical protein